MPSSRADRRIVTGTLAALALGAAVWLAPQGYLALATRGALACLDDERAPPGGPLCDAAEAQLAQVSAVPWVRRDATYRYEELRARRARLGYVETAVGTPDPEARAAAGKTIEVHEEIVEEGSARLRLEELGPPIGAPDVGAIAREFGDRETLRAQYDHLGLWTHRLAALRAALQDGALDEAETIAARYAEFDPRDGDLRTAVGATLCLGRDPGRGLELLARVPADRAEKRHAAIARDFGAVRAVQEACADLAGIEPPELPTDRAAGLPDAEEARAVQGLRLAQEGAERKEALATARALLEGLAPPAGSGLSPTVPGARVALLAEVLRVAPGLEAETVLKLATPRDPAEGPLLPGGRLDPTRLLHEPLLDGPYVAPEAFSEAAAHVDALLPGAGEELATGDAGALRRVSAALQLRAAVGFARLGEVEKAREAGRTAATKMGDPARGAQLRASLAAMAGDPDEARTAAGAGGPQVELALAEAMAAASVGKREEAASAVLRAAPAEGPPDVELAVQRRLWDLAVGAPAPAPVAGAPMDAWVGFAEASGRWRTDGASSLRALGPLAEAVMATQEPERRRSRRAFLARRGDAPDDLVPWTIALGRMCSPDTRGSAVETWLDAALSVDEARYAMREIALARQIAARVRGDVVSAERWGAALSSLRGLFGDPRRAVIARYLGL